MFRFAARAGAVPSRCGVARPACQSPDFLAPTPPLLVSVAEFVERFEIGRANYRVRAVYVTH